MSAKVLQPVEGATPPAVFSRWMNLVFVRMSPPSGPFWDPVAVTLSQAMAWSATNLGSVEASPSGFCGEGGFTKPQTVLVSLECCQVARIGPVANSAGLVLGSNGLGLKKWVVSCLPSSLDSTASGVKSVKATPPV